MSDYPSPSPTIKTALVLAGGGLTGAVYEIGALRAIDDLLVDLDTSKFDIYVGTSAGAMVAAFLANGIKPADMMRGLDNNHPNIHGPRPTDLFAVNVREWVERAAGLPRTLWGAARHYRRHWRDMKPFDAALALGEALPTAFFHNYRLADYIRETLHSVGGSDYFDQLNHELYIIATDLDNGQRAVFGQGELSDVPISLAVAASAAVPVLYRPVRVNDHDYIDGGVRGMASLDVAIEHGAKLIVVVNSAVPLDNSQRTGIPFFDPTRRHLSDKGMAAVVAQVYRTLFHSGLVYQIKQVRRRHPDVTIILIEPDPTDSAMFFFNSMRYSARMTIAQHGYESVTVNLAQDYKLYKDLLDHYGISITSRYVNKELYWMEQAGNDPDAIADVMENSLYRPPEEAPSLEAASLEATSLSDRLGETLDNLELILAGRRNGQPTR